MSTAVAASISTEQVARRRAVEALRSGVPSWDAVAALGSGQQEAEDRVGAMLERMGRGSGPSGVLLGGGFGAGKSHLLTHLGHLALDAGFVVSTVTISKETPLHDPGKVFRAAIESAVGPGRIQGALADAAAAVDPDSPRYAELTRWANSSGSAVDERFPATLLLHERLRGGDAPDSDEMVDAVVRFWSGDPIRVPDLRRAMRAAGAAGLYTFSPIRQRDLDQQRFPFVARLLRAAGHAGWLILFDEVELIGRYSVLQRGRSYGEIARWLDGTRDDAGAPLAAVLAMTDDYEAAVLSGKGDRERVPQRLRDKQRPEWDEVAALAEDGMRHIERDLVLLSPPDDEELDRAYGLLKRLHGEAFDWSPPDVAGLERLGATRMRQYVRAWINEWDLIRLDPGYRPQTEVLDVSTDYREDADVEGAGP
jgi:hypothetical protein